MKPKAKLENLEAVYRVVVSRAEIRRFIEHGLLRAKLAAPHQVAAHLAAVDLAQVGAVRRRRRRHHLRKGDERKPLGPGAYTRSTSQLNVSAFCGIGGAFRGCSGGV